MFASCCWEWDVTLFSRNTLGTSCLWSSLITRSQTCIWWVKLLPGLLYYGREVGSQLDDSVRFHPFFKVINENINRKNIWFRNLKIWINIDLHHKVTNTQQNNPNLCSFIRKLLLFPWGDCLRHNIKKIKNKNLFLYLLNRQQEHPLDWTLIPPSCSLHLPPLSPHDLPRPYSLEDVSTGCLQRERECLMF